jgi:hypothetical protein
MTSDNSKCRISPFGSSFIGSILFFDALICPSRILLVAKIVSIGDYIVSPPVLISLLEQIKISRYSSPGQRSHPKWYKSLSQLRKLMIAGVYVPSLAFSKSIHFSL